MKILLKKCKSQYGHHSPSIGIVLERSGYTNELRTTEHAIDFGVNYSKAVVGDTARRGSVQCGVSGADVPQSIQGQNVELPAILGNWNLPTWTISSGARWRALVNYRGAESIRGRHSRTRSLPIASALDKTVQSRDELSTSQSLRRLFEW